MRIFWMMVLLALLGGAAFGDSGGIAASLPEGFTPRPGEWEMLLVHATAPAPQQIDVSVQDVRGGPSVSRRVLPGASGSIDALLTLPLLDDATLGDRWHVRVTLRGAGSSPIQQEIAIPLPRDHVTRQAFLLVTGEGARTKMQEEGPWSSIVRDAEQEWAELPEREILDAPALVFGGVDGVVIPESLRARLSAARAKVLIAAGARIIFPGSPPAGLGEIAWEMVRDAPGRTAWISVPVTRRPDMLEPGLADLVDWRKPVVAQAADVRITYWLGPAALVVAVLCYELFRRRGTVLLAWLIALAALSLGAIAYVGATASEVLHVAAWNQSATADGKPPATALHESLHIASPLLARRIDAMARDDEILYPVAASTREYWNWRGLTLELPDSEAPMRLTGMLPARSLLAWETRSFTAFTHPEPANVLSGGYVAPTGNFQIPPDATTGTIFNAWASAQPPAVRDDWNAWYALRFSAARGYFLFPGSPDAPIGIVERSASAAP